MVNIKLDFTIFKERLRQLVERTGKTQAVIAEDLGISAPTLNRYLAGKRTPDLPYVVQLSNYFKVSIDWILGLNGDQFDVLPPETQEVALCYMAASDDDRSVVDAVLKKYKSVSILQKEATDQ